LTWLFLLLVGLSGGAGESLSWDVPLKASLVVVQFEFFAPCGQTYRVRSLTYGKETNAKLLALKFKLDHYRNPRERSNPTRRWHRSNSRQKSHQGPHPEAHQQPLSFPPR
jgi:hypothetical protein